LLRVRQVVDAAGESGVAGRTWLALGLFSMLVAALFLLGTQDFKRMLAYSSVEHMGILSVGAALGGAGVAAALFHVWTNGLTKGALFLSAGNMRRAAGASRAETVSGMAWLTPVSVRIFVAGLFAVTAGPPFGPFFSELQILRAGLEVQAGWSMAMFIGCLVFAFFGLTRLVFAIADGRPQGTAISSGRRFRESAGVIVPPLVLLGCSLWLGLATPMVLRETWASAAQCLFSRP
jgi:hydrogenase-4 component F